MDAFKKMAFFMFLLDLLFIAYKASSEKNSRRSNLRTSSPTRAELLFEVFSQRYERGSTIVTSSLPFDEWATMFGSKIARINQRTSA